jgi:hypothetical protein
LTTGVYTTVVLHKRFQTEENGRPYNTRQTVIKDKTAFALVQRMFRGTHPKRMEGKWGSSSSHLISKGTKAAKGEPSPVGRFLLLAPVLGLNG